MLCPICAIPGAPTPSGIETHTHDGVIHRTRECASLAAAKEHPVRTANGYKSKSGRLACDPCYYLGAPHSYAPDEDPHPPEMLAAQHSRVQLLEQQRLIGIDETVKLIIDEWLSPGGKRGRRISREPYTPSDRRMRAREKARAAMQRRQARESETERDNASDEEERTTTRTPPQDTG